MQPEASLQAWNVNESSFPANESQKEKLTFLLNYAILAPSSHNSQPWKFNVTNDSILVFADESRWLQVADADKRELYISLGCALENLIIAADRFGYNSTVAYFPDGKDLAAIVTLKPAYSSSADPRLFPAILSRQTDRNLYEPRAISESDLETMNSICSDADIGVFATSDPAIKKSFQDITVQANGIQYSDANFKSELGHWLGQGAMGPRGMQAKMAQLAVVFLDVGPEQTEKDALLINSTPYLGFISAANNDSLSSVKAGRILERFWLCATALGISLHPMSQALETAQTRENLTGLLSGRSGMKPELRVVQQVFRLGYGRPAPEHSTRRPLADVMVSER